MTFFIASPRSPGGLAVPHPAEHASALAQASLIVRVLSPDGPAGQLEEYVLQGRPAQVHTVDLHPVLAVGEAGDQARDERLPAVGLQDQLAFRPLARLPALRPPAAAGNPRCGAESGDRAPGWVRPGRALWDGAAGRGRFPGAA